MHTTINARCDRREKKESKGSREHRQWLTGRFTSEHAGSASLGYPSRLADNKWVSSEDTAFSPVFESLSCVPLTISRS